MTSGDILGGASGGGQTLQDVWEVSNISTYFGGHSHTGVRAVPIGTSDSNSGKSIIQIMEDQEDRIEDLEKLVQQLIKQFAPEMAI